MLICEQGDGFQQWAGKDEGYYDDAPDGVYARSQSQALYSAGYSDSEQQAGGRDAEELDTQGWSRTAKYDSVEDW